MAVKRYPTEYTIAEVKAIGQNYMRTLYSAESLYSAEFRPSDMEEMALQITIRKFAEQLRDSGFAVAEDEIAIKEVTSDFNRNRNAVEYEFAWSPLRAYLAGYPATKPFRKLMVRGVDRHIDDIAHPFDYIGMPFYVKVLSWPTYIGYEANLMPDFPPTKIIETHLAGWDWKDQCWIYRPED